MQSSVFATENPIPTETMLAVDCAVHDVHVL